MEVDALPAEMAEVAAAVAGGVENERTQQLITLLRTRGRHNADWAS